MKVLLVLAVAFAITEPSIASAACNTASLAGNWYVKIYSDICALKISRVGAISGSCEYGGKISGTITLDSTCKIAGKMMTYSFSGRTEAIDSRSSLVPNLMIGRGVDIGHINAYRQ